MNDQLPQFLQELINSPPYHGQGVHAWLFKVSCQLHAHMPATEIVDLLASKIKNCGRDVPRREIVAAVKDSLPVAWRPRGSPDAAPSEPKKPKWPPWNVHNMRLYAKQHSLLELYESSPVTVPDDTESAIDLLFPQDCLLCCGASSQSFATKPRAQWRGQLHALSFIVPSPMSDVTGLTKDGKISQHCLNNTGPRRFIVCEFDQGTPNQQASILMHLSNYAPLACVVSSGGKSIHGWFWCKDVPEEKIRKFFAYAVSLGADPPGWIKSQFMRMPDGTRDNGAAQPVFFLNPKVVQ